MMSLISRDRLRRSHGGRPKHEKRRRSVVRMLLRNPDRRKKSTGPTHNDAALLHVLRPAV